MRKFMMRLNASKGRKIVWQAESMEARSHSRVVNNEVAAMQIPTVRAFNQFCKPFEFSVSMKNHFSGFAPVFSDAPPCA